MEKKPEVDGAYVEVEATELTARSDEVAKSTVLTVVNARLELAGDDKRRFVAKFNGMAEKFADETKGMDDRQKSFYILRQMLVS